MHEQLRNKLSHLIYLTIHDQNVSTAKLTDEQKFLYEQEKENRLTAVLHLIDCASCLLTADSQCDMSHAAFALKCATTVYPDLLQNYDGGSI